MIGEADLSKLLKEMSPKLNSGEYVFSTINDLGEINHNDTICTQNRQLICELCRWEVVGFFF
jgi:hypothetical protein